MAFVFASSAVRAAEDPAMLLFEAFSSKCDSQGRFTARVLNETNALEGVLKTLMNDQECQGLGPVLASLTSLDNQLQSMNDTLWSVQRGDLEAKLQRLGLYYGLANTVEEQSLLATEMAQTQIMILDGDTTEQERRNIATVYAANQMGRYLEVVSEAYPRLQMCFERNQYLPFQLGAHLVSLSGAFTWNPAAYAAMAIGGRLIASLFNYLNNRKFVEGIMKIRGSKLQAGLSCAMESLEKTVCEIRDHRKLLALHREYRKQATLPAEWKGYDLFRRQYPIVQEFLRQVEAGADPNSAMQGMQRSEFRQIEGAYRATVAMTKGRIAEANRKLHLIESDPDGAAAKTVILGLIDDLANDLGFYDSLHRSIDSIFTRVVPSPHQIERIKLWLVTGNPSPSVSGMEAENPYAILLNRALEGALDTELIGANLNSVLRAGQIQLDLQKTMVLNPDPQGAASTWTRRSLNFGSAGEVMVEWVQYLKTLEDTWRARPQWFQDSFAQRDQLELLIDTRLRFEEVLKILRDEEPKESGARSTGSQPLQNAREKLRKIMNVMDLQEQDQVITTRLREIVQMDLEKRFRAGELVKEQSLRASIALATEDILVGLYPHTPHYLNRVDTDLNEADVLAKFNIKNFYDFFLKSLIQSLKELKEQADLWKEGPQGANNLKFSRMCILALNAPQLGSKDFKQVVQLCRGRMVQVEVQEESLGVSFDAVIEKTLELPEERLCSYRDLQNRIDLKELKEQSVIRQSAMRR